MFFLSCLGTERIDMKRLTNILERIVLEYFSTLESNPHDSITFSVIGDALYGETEEDVRNNLYSIYIFQTETLEFIYQF